MSQSNGDMPQPWQNPLECTEGYEPDCTAEEMQATLDRISGREAEQLKAAIRYLLSDDLLGRDAQFTRDAVHIDALNGEEPAFVALAVLEEA